MAGTKLSLSNLCQLCSRLNIKPRDLFTDQGNEEDIKRQQVVLRGDISLLRVITPWGEVEGHLKVALQEQPPPSLEAVSRRMGYYPPKVKRHFPQLCEQIIFRYREYQKSTHPPLKEVRRVFRSALKESPPPSLQMVLRRLGCHDTGYYYYSNYGPLCFAVTDRFKRHRNRPFNKDEDCKRLKAALAEEPPPSFSEVARRFGHNRDFIRRKYPELSRAVAARHMHYQNLLRRDNADRLRRVIREAVDDLTGSGIYVSEARVQRYVRQHLTKLGRGSTFKRILREVKSDKGISS